MKTHTQIKSMPGFDKKALLGALLAAGMVMGSGSALAAVGTGNLQVTASVGSTCTISDGRLSFGQYATAANATEPLDATSVDVAALCTSGTVFHVYSTTVTRALVSGVNTLNFELYSDTGRTIVLPVANTSGAIAGVGNGITPVPISIYGRMAAGQTATAGIYALATNLTIFY